MRFLPRKVRECRIRALDGMDKRSVGEKAVLINKMPTKEKMAAMKAAGQDASKMSPQDKGSRCRTAAG